MGDGACTGLTRQTAGVLFSSARVGRTVRSYGAIRMHWPVRADASMASSTRNIAEPLFAGWLGFRVVQNRARKVDCFRRELIALGIRLGARGSGDGHELLEPVCIVVRDERRIFSTVFLAFPRPTTRSPRAPNSLWRARTPARPPPGRCCRARPPPAANVAPCPPVFRQGAWGREAREAVSWEALDRARSA